MGLDRPVHAPETADGTMFPAVAAPVAPEATVHGVLAQMFNPPPPPPGFSALLGGRVVIGSLRPSPLTC